MRKRGIGAGPTSEADSCFVRNLPPSVPRSERFSALFPLLRQNQLAQNRLVGAFGRVSRPFRPDGTLLACYVLPGMSPAAPLREFLGSPYPQPPRIGYRVPAFRVAEREFGGPMRAWRPRPTAPAEMALLQPGLITEGRIG